jgi:hypothetical protein
MLVIFVVLKLRNRQKAVALPVLDQTQMAYLRQVGIQENYQQLPPPQYEALPPASTMEQMAQYPSGQWGTAQDVQGAPVGAVGASVYTEVPVAASSEEDLQSGPIGTFETNFTAPQPAAEWGSTPPDPQVIAPMQEPPSDGNDGAGSVEAPVGSGGTELPAIPPPPDI